MKDCSKYRFCVCQGVTHSLTPSRLGTFRHRCPAFVVYSYTLPPTGTDANSLPFTILVFPMRQQYCPANNHNKQMPLTIDSSLVSVCLWFIVYLLVIFFHPRQEAKRGGRTGRRRRQLPGPVVVRRSDSGRNSRLSW